MFKVMESPKTDITVGELIELLKELPQDWKVNYILECWEFEKSTAVIQVTASKKFSYGLEQLMILAMRKR